MASSDTQRPLHQAAPKELLKLEGGVSLAFEGDNLTVKDKAQAKKNRKKLCGFPVGSGQPELTIPFYNVLWAEVTKEDDGPLRLVIDYAHAKTHQVQPRRLVYPVAQDQAKNTSDNGNDNNGNNDDALAPSVTTSASIDVQAWVEALLSRAYGPGQQRRRRARVIVNPHAGPGGAERIWEQEVRPLFEAARLVIDATYTARAGEAVGICEHLDVGAYDVVVPCSGDGLPHEVFNGLGRRRDARSALRRLAVAHIPCGSGNAMSCNLNGSYRPGEAALAVIKGVRTPMDLMSITQGGGRSSNNGASVTTATEAEGQAQAQAQAENNDEEPVRRTLSFLSQSVGLIAECDLGTENLRWMGAARFDVGVAQRVLKKKVYPCDVAVKVEVAGKDHVKARYRRDKAQADYTVRKEGDRSGGAADSSDDLVEDGDEEGLPTLRYGTIGDKIPDDWEKLTLDNMGSFYCGNMPWMAPAANFFPATTPNDGVMDLIINDGNIPTVKYFDLMLGIEKEKFFDNPLLSYRKISAYRITPRDQKDGYISIDGERIPFEPFQVEIHQGLATVLSKRGQYEANGPTGWENAPIDENEAA